MSEEATNITYDDDVAEEAEAPEVEEVEEEAPEEKPEEDERIELDEKTQAKVDKIIQSRLARNTEKLQAAEDARRKAEQELSRYSQQPASQQQRPEIPPMPDPFDDDFEKKVAARDEVIQKAARFDAYQDAMRYQEQQQVQANLQQAQQELTNTVNTYNERAKKLGVKSDELQLAGKQVAAIGMAPDLVQYVLGDDKGPAMTVYLAKNLEELEKLQTMSPIKAAIYLETVIKPKASERSRKSPPPPTDSPRGAGMPEGKRGPKGATYE